MVFVTVYITYLKCLHPGSIVEERHGGKKSLISKVKKYANPFSNKMTYESECISDYCPACKAHPNIDKPSYNRSKTLPSMNKTQAPAPRCDNHIHVDTEIVVASSKSPDNSDINTEYVYDMNQRHMEIDQYQGWADSYVKAAVTSASSHGTHRERCNMSNDSEKEATTEAEIRRKPVPPPASPSGHGRDVSWPMPALGRSMTDTHWQNHHNTPRRGSTNLDSEDISEGGISGHRINGRVARRSQQWDPEVPSPLRAVSFA
jgi:transcription elongation factor Elf1